MSFCIDFVPASFENEDNIVGTWTDENDNNNNNNNNKS